MNKETRQAMNQLYEEMQLIKRAMHTLVRGESLLIRELKQQQQKQRNTDQWVTHLIQNRTDTKQKYDKLTQTKEE